MDDSVREKVRQLVVEHGVPAPSDPRRSKSLLLDYCPHNVPEVNLLVQALEANVAADLVVLKDACPWNLTADRMVARLVEDHRSREDDAAWVVETWAFALGLISESDLTQKQLRNRGRTGEFPRRSDNTGYEIGLESAGATSDSRFMPAYLGNIGGTHLSKAPKGGLKDWDGCGPCEKCKTVINMIFADATCPVCGHRMTPQDAHLICARHPGDLPVNCRSERELPNFVFPASADEAKIPSASEEHPIDEDKSPFGIESGEKAIRAPLESTTNGGATDGSGAAMASEVEFLKRLPAEAKKLAEAKRSQEMQRSLSKHRRKAAAKKLSRPAAEQEPSHDDANASIAAGTGTIVTGVSIWSGPMTTPPVENIKVGIRKLENLLEEIYNRGRLSAEDKDRVKSTVREHQIAPEVARPMVEAFIRRLAAKPDEEPAPTATSPHLRAEEAANDDSGVISFGETALVGAGSSEFPQASAEDMLRQTIRHVLADGIVTTDERTEFQAMCKKLGITREVSTRIVAEVKAEIRLTRQDRSKSLKVAEDVSPQLAPVALPRPSSSPLKLCVSTRRPRGSVELG
jgi:hypothetical protein